MLVICPIFDRCELLPFYLRHYHRLGGTKFVIALWNGWDNPLVDEVCWFGGAGGYDMSIRTSARCELKDFNGPAETPGLNSIREEWSDVSRWYCIADLDEFCSFGIETMPEVCEEAERQGFEAVHGTFYDRLAANGRFPRVNLKRSLDETFPMTAWMTEGLETCSTSKVPLARMDIPIESGHHQTSGKVWENRIVVHHFKWTEGIEERLAQRHKYFTAQGLPWAGEGAHFLEVIQSGIYRKDPKYGYTEAARIGL